MNDKSGEIIEELEEIEEKHGIALSEYKEIAREIGRIKRWTDIGFKIAIILMPLIIGNMILGIVFENHIFLIIIISLMIASFVNLIFVIVTGVRIKKMSKRMERLDQIKIDEK